MNLNAKIIVVLFLLSMQSIFCTDNVNPATDNKKEFDKNFYFTPVVYTAPTTPHQPFGQAPQYNNELDPIIADLSYSAAPERIKSLVVKMLLHPNSVLKKRQYLFVGPPGSGKTTLAQAIAQKAGWDSVVISVPELANEYQNSAASGLKRIIDPLITAKKKCVIILDELTHITDNYKKAYNYNNDAAAAVWSLLDRCKEHEHIIVIATSNDISDLPPQMKSRFNGTGIIEISTPSFQAREMLVCHLFQDLISKSSQNDMNYFINLINKMDGKSFRDIMDFAEQVTEHAEADGRTSIQKKDIDAVIKTWRSKWHPVEMYRASMTSIKETLTNSSPYIPVAGLALSLYQVFLQESYLMNRVREVFAKSQSNIVKKK